MRRVRHTIGGTGAPLAAHLPAQPPLGLALLADCFTCSKDDRATTRTARGLTARGIGVLRLDFTGLGESGGEFGDSTFSMNVEDLIRAADWLRAEIGAPTLLVGHSQPMSHPTRTPAGNGEPHRPAPSNRAGNPGAGRADRECQMNGVTGRDG